MREFSSLAAFAAHLAVIESAEVLALHRGLGRVAKAIERTAKTEVGHYQPETGVFAEWAELADSTEADKARHGYPVDAPLLRTGEMRDSIEHQVGGGEAVIGSNSDKLVWQEFGTKKIPARSVLGMAAVRNRDLIYKIMGNAAVSGLIGEEAIHPSLGYDFEV